MLQSVQILQQIENLLQKTEGFISLKNASVLTSVSVRTLRQWIEQGKINAYKPEGRYLINKNELIQFIEKHKVKP